MSDEKSKIPFSDAEIQFIKKLDEKRVTTENRFPLLTALLATFGFVSLLYGFEKLIDSSEYLSENPIILLVIGIVVLLFTGTFYKKLG